MAVDSVLKLVEKESRKSAGSLLPSEPLARLPKRLPGFTMPIHLSFSGGLPMSFFAIQVTSGREDAYIKFFSKQRPDQTLYNIKKKIRSRKKGKPTIVTTSLFPGYLFFKFPEDSLSGELLTSIRKTKYFIRVLPATDNIKPLGERDTSIIKQLVSFGGEIGSSVVSFDENNKIKVIQGPMMGMEGRIIKVDRRKKRAKVRLEMNDSPISFDLSFEVLESIKEG